jgi:hypothetical protein
MSGTRRNPLSRRQQWAEGVISPQMAEEVDRSNSFPKDVDVWREMGSFGLLGRWTFRPQLLRSSAQAWRMTEGGG